MTRERGARALAALAIGLAAALWFLGAIGATIGLTDEGQVVYPSWRVAEGEIPYVDFHHLYGPSLFFLNGALLRWLGADLHVVRLSLVVVKALVVVLVWVLGRRVAPAAATLVVCAFLVAVWGAPMWLFNAPYATYYATPLSLAGVLVASGGRGPGRWLVSGLLVGVAATFKQTQGVFAFLSLVLFLVFAYPPAAGAGRDGRLVRRLAGLARLLALVAIPVLALAYMAGHLATGTALVLLLPIVAGALGLLARDLRAWPPGDAAVASLGPLLAASLGLLLPALAYGWFYARLGALPAVVFDTIHGLPERVAWFTPFPRVARRSVWLGAIVGTSFAVLVAWRRSARWLALALAALAASAVGLFLAVRGRPWLGGPSIDDLLALLPWLPIVALATAALTPIRDDPAAGAPGATRDAVALLVFFGAASLLQLYPAADVPHGAMVLPAFLPLLAHALGRAARRHGGAILVLAACWLVGAAWPFLRPRLLPDPTTLGPPAFARASAVVRTDPRMAEAARLVRWLAGARVPEGGLLLLTDEQMILFLAGVRSALPRDEFTLYLVSAGLVDDEVARALVDERAAVERLTRERPLVVDYPGSVEAERFRRTFPRIAAFITERYREAAAIDGYRVLAPSSRAPLTAGAAP